MLCGNLIYIAKEKMMATRKTTAESKVEKTIVLRN